MKRKTRNRAIWHIFLFLTRLEKKFICVENFTIFGTPVRKGLFSLKLSWIEICELSQTTWIKLANIANKDELSVYEFWPCFRKIKKAVSYEIRGVCNSNLPLLISFSERLLICLFDFLFLSFLSFWPFGLSYFLIFSPTLPRYPHPFRTFYLPWNTATSNIDILPAVPLVTCRKYRYVTPSLNFPSHSYQPLFLSYA